MTASLRSLPLPDDPNLAACALALNDAGHWADVFDARWRYVFATDELRLSLGDTGAVTFLPIGCHFFSAEETQLRVSVNRGGFVLPEYRRAHFLEIAPYVLAIPPAAEKSFVASSIPSSRTWSTDFDPKILLPCGLRLGCCLRSRVST